MLWGILLVVMSLPLRRLVVTGKLDRWMAFGADVGKDGMVGASSGLGSSSSSRSVWRLRISGGKVEMAAAGNDATII